jgi:peroxiredoxin
MKKLFFLLVISLFANSAFAQKTTLKVGQPAPEIALPQPDGDTLSLSSMRGEVVLIDFWATWCAPCVKEQSELKKIYQKYNQLVKKGRFQILGVSLDEKKSHWKKGIQRLDINWPQVSDLQFWNSRAAKDYGIEALPFNVIVNEEGKIVAINLHGKKLNHFLKKRLK